MIKKLSNSSLCRVYSLKTPKIWPIAGRGMKNMLNKISTYMILLSSMFVMVLFFESIPYFIFHSRPYRVTRNFLRFPVLSTKKQEMKLPALKKEAVLPFFQDETNVVQCLNGLKNFEFHQALQIENSFQLLQCLTLEWLLRCRFTYSAF